MKINQKKAIETATTAGSAVVGAKLSKAANTIIPAYIKNPAVHGVVSIAAIVVASVITGTSLGAQVGRGLAIGAAIDQGNTAINSVVTPMLPPSDGSKKTLALDAAFEKNTAALKGYRGLKSDFSPAVADHISENQQAGVFATI